MIKAYMMDMHLRLTWEDQRLRHNDSDFKVITRSRYITTTRGL